MTEEPIDTTPIVTEPEAEASTPEASTPETLNCVYRGPYQVLVEQDVEYRIGDPMNLTAQRLAELRINNFTTIEEVESTTD